MPARRFLSLAFVLATVLMGGCKDQREPVKPIVDLSDTALAA